MGPRPFGRGMRQHRNGVGDPDVASMGPRPFGRGMLALTFSIDSKKGRFNGAATFRSRNEHIWAFDKESFFQLQWGRDLSVAECTNR